MRLSTSLKRAAAVSAALATATAPLVAQDVPDKELPKPNGVIRDLIKDPGRAFAQQDGKVLVVDMKAQKLVRADFDKGSVDEVMTGGGEPNQFRGISAIWPWNADSVVVFDAGRQRGHIVPWDGTPARMLTMMDSSIMTRVDPPQGAMGGRGGGAPPRPFYRAPINPRFMWDGKHVYGTGVPMPTGGRVPPGTAPPRTQVPILRLDIETWAIDTLASITFPQANKSAQRRDNQSNRNTGLLLTYDATWYMPADTWVVYQDGTVGIIRGANYRIDLYAPGGQRGRIEPVAYPKVDITEGEKKRYMERTRKEAEEALSQSPNRPGSVTWEDSWTWPKQHPPFFAKSQTHVDPQDRVWLHVRCQNDDKADCYDVIDRQGQRVARWKLPANTELVTVGNNAVYTLFLEKKDKPVLQRHPLP